METIPSGDRLRVVRSRREGESIHGKRNDCVQRSLDLYTQSTTPSPSRGRGRSRRLGVTKVIPRYVEISVVDNKGLFLRTCPRTIPHDIRLRPRVTLPVFTPPCPPSLSESRLRIFFFFSERVTNLHRV